MGSEIFLRNVNLNLLPILQMLLRARSVSGAATALGLSQPAVSDALSRLRVILEDQLLIRVGVKMKLTPRAAELIEPLEKLCGSMEHFFSKTTFDPMHAKREFVIATSDICAYMLARPIMDMLVAEAPAISMHLVDVGYDLTDKMSACEIDFALLPHFALDDLAPVPLRFKMMLQTPPAVLMRKGHPLASKEMIENIDLVQYRNITFQPDAVMKDPGRIFTMSQGMKFDIVARVGQALLVPHLLQGTDFLTVLPKKLAEDMTRLLPLEMRPLSYITEKHEMGLAWSPVYDDDPAHEWFRTAVTKYVAVCA